MANVTIKYDPQGISRPDKIFSAGGYSSIDIILDETPVEFRYLSVMLNGKMLALPVVDSNGVMISEGDEEELTRPLSQKDDLRIMCLQKGGALDFVAPVFSFSTSAARSATSKALSWIYKTPSYGSNESSQSGKSQDLLAGQSNSTGLYSAIPDRFGQSVVYPDLIDNEAFTIYSDNTQTITQFMCVGLGEYDWNDVYLGSTQIGLVGGATVERFEPVNGITTIPNYFFSRSVEQVSRSDLESATTRNVFLSANNNDIFFTFDSVNDFGRIDVGLTNTNPLFSNFFTTGESVIFTGADNIIGADNGAGVTRYNLNGTYNIQSVDERFIVFSSAQTVASGWQYIDSDFGTGVTSYQDGSASSGMQMKSVAKSITFQGPFYTATKGRGFLLDFGFYSGLKGTVTVRIEYTVHESIDGPAIASGTIDQSYSANTFDQKNYTYQFNYSGTDQNNYYFGVRVARTTEESTDAANPDTIKWDRFSSYSQFSSRQFSYGPTFIKVVVPYSSSSLSPSSNKVNITATRKTITYDMETGLVVDTIAPSLTFADALLHVVTVTHGRDAGILDLDSLYEISERIGYPLNGFSYSFQGLRQSLEDKMSIICNVARVSFSWDGQKYQFYREESKAGTTPSIISRADIANADDRQYSRNYNSNLPTSYDSIKLEYVFPDRNNEAAYIRLKYDANGNIVNGLGINPNSITLSGCRNKEQAINRAQLEIRRLIFGGWAVQDTLLSNGYLYNKGDYVQYQDVFRSDAFSGEILEISGNKLTLSSLVKLEIGTSYEIWYNDEMAITYGPFDLANGDGSESDIVYVSNESDMNNAYTRNNMMGDSMQVGSRFTINKVSTGPVETFLVDAKEGVDSNRVNISLEQYDERIFGYDGV